MDYARPLRTHTVNIGKKENMKFANIRDYWNDKTMEKIVDLLHQYQGLFSTTFSEIKWISRELGKMKILLKLQAKTIEKRPYRLNPL